MPIYEFYCRDCNTVFSFFSNRVDTESRPACPRCQHPDLERKPSRFATLKPRNEHERDSGPLEALEDPRMEAAMEQLMREMDGGGIVDGGIVNGGASSDSDDDPRQMGHFLSRFSELSGLELSDRMRDIVDRLERGDDPDALEAQLGEPPDDDAEALSELFQLKQKALARRSRKPEIDETLYFL